MTNGVPAGGLTRSMTGTLYAQLYDALLQQIRNGTYQPGHRLPTEAELGELYGVSRMTVRRALDELRRSGLVERKPALGTFVAEPSLAARITGVHSLTDEIVQLGMTPGSRLLAREILPAAADIAAQLEVPEGSEILRLDRVRTADGRPFYAARSYLNIVAFPELATQDYASDSLSLLDTYRRVLGLEAERMTQLLSATAAPPLAREAFELPVGSPVLLFERVVYVRGDRPVEYVRAYFRGDSYKFYSELS
ncbi:MAG: GntR family transcriptional regulator [Propionicimonas sp.]